MLNTEKRLFMTFSSQVEFMHKLFKDSSHELLLHMKDGRWWDANEAKYVWIDAVY